MKHHVQLGTIQPLVHQLESRPFTSQRPLLHISLCLYQSCILALEILILILPTPSVVPILSREGSIFYPNLAVMINREIITVLFITCLSLKPQHPCGFLPPYSHHSRNSVKLTKISNNLWMIIAYHRISTTYCKTRDKEALLYTTKNSHTYP